MEIGEVKFLNAWNAIPGVGAATLRVLKNHFGSFERAWRAGETAYESAHLDPQAIAAIRERKKTIDPDREIQKLSRGDIWMITEEDATYPPILKEIPVPPIMLYGHGSRELLAQKICVAVVGTRRPTPYGLDATETMVSALAGAGLAIVSGLATGIDTKAHTVALAKKGHTIAVLGSGIDGASIFPPQNRGLAERIAGSGGAVISEYAPGTPAVKEHFPLRNRIISGLSRGTLVVEARERSGALITARYALEQNRDVFAVPGSIFSATSAGPLALIREGALAVTSGAHILDALGIDPAAATRDTTNQNLGNQEKTLLALLETPESVDAIKEKTGLATAAIMASLSLLELKGYVRHCGGDTFQRI